METPMVNKRLSPVGLVNLSLSFFGTHFIFVFGAGLIAAIGRAIQLGAMGSIPGGLNTLLEIVIEAARILTFLSVLGEGKIVVGTQRIKSLFTLSFDQWKTSSLIIITNVKVNWLALVINLVIYSTIAFIVNFIIDKIAYGTDLLTSLQNSRVLVHGTSEWVLLLFFKNLTVIPFTIIFNGILLLWITNSLQPNHRPPRH